MENEFESLYCKTCEGCGEDGCCSWLNCFRNLVDKHKCDYGEHYLKDAEFDSKIADLGCEIINEMKVMKTPIKELLAKYDSEWDRIWEEIFKKEE